MLVFDATYDPPKIYKSELRSLVDAPLKVLATNRAGLSPVFVKLDQIPNSLQFSRKYIEATNTSKFKDHVEQIFFVQEPGVFEVESLAVDWKHRKATKIFYLAFDGGNNLQMIDKESIGKFLDIIKNPKPQEVEEEITDTGFDFDRFKVLEID